MFLVLIVVLSLGFFGWGFGGILVVTYLISFGFSRFVTYIAYLSYVFSLVSYVENFLFHDFKEFFTGPVAWMPFSSILFLNQFEDNLILF